MSLAIERYEGTLSARASAWADSAVTEGSRDER